MEKERDSNEDSSLKLLGQQVRRFRKEAGLSQEKLAELVNVSLTTISRMENGHQMVAVEKLIQIAEALEMNAGDLFLDFSFEGNREKEEVDVQLQKVLKNCNAHEKGHILAYTKMFLAYTREEENSSKYLKK